MLILQRFPFKIQRKFLSNLLLLLVLNLLVKPFYLLGIDAEVQSRVDTSAYGSYFALINLSFLLNFLLDFGTTNYNTRQVARSGLESEHYSGMFSLRLLLAAAYMVLVLVVAMALGYQSFSIYLLLLLGFNQVLAAFILFFRSNLGGMHLFRQDSLISVLDRILLIALMSVLLWSGFIEDDAFKIEWFVYAQTICYGITALLAFVLVRKNGGRLAFQANLKDWKSKIRQSLPFALLIMMMMLYHRMDGVMLERMLQDEGAEAGIYARAYRFFEALSMLAYLFSVLLLPIFSRALAEKKPVYELMSVSLRLLIAGLWPAAVLCYFLSEEILGLRYDNHIAHTAPVFGWLMLSAVAFGSTYIYGTLMTAKAEMKSLNYIALSGVVLNASLNFILIPEYGAYGAAVATLITQVLAAIAQLLATYRSFRFKFELKLWFGLSFFMLSVWFLAKHHTIFGADWKFQSLSLLGLSVLIAGITGLLPLKAFVRILRERVSRSAAP